MSRKIVQDLGQFPKEKHYAIMEFETMRIPEDGPEYPSYYEPITKYYTYGTYTAWVLAIKMKELGGEKFVAFQTTPATIVKTVSVEIKL